MSSLSLVPRLASLFLCFSLAVAVEGLCIRALVILRHRQRLISSALPQGQLHGGKIVAVASVLVAAVAIAAIVACFSATSLFLKRAPLSLMRPLYAFASVFTLAATIASTVVASSNAKVTAAPTIPPAVISQLITASGMSLKYTDIPVVKAVVVVAWCQWLATVASAVFEFMAPRRGSTIDSNTREASPESHGKAEKGSVSETTHAA